MLRLSSIKYFDKGNYSKLVTEQTMYVLFVRPNQKLCTYSRQFWNDFESCLCFLSNQQVRISSQNVVFGIISKQCPSNKLLYYSWKAVFVGQQMKSSSS